MQDAIAGNEPAPLRQSAVPGNEIGPHEAVSVKEYAVFPAAGQDGAVAYLRRTETLVLLPYVAERNADARAPTINQRAGLGSRAVIGHDQLETSVSLMRYCGQHRGKGINTIVRRDYERDKARHFAV